MKERSVDAKGFKAALRAGAQLLCVAFVMVAAGHASAKDETRKVSDEDRAALASCLKIAA